MESPNHQVCKKTKIPPCDTTKKNRAKVRVRPRATARVRTTTSNTYYATGWNIAADIRHKKKSKSYVTNEQNPREQAKQANLV